MHRFVIVCCVGAFGVLAVGAAFSSAGLVPRATLAQRADAICVMENKRRAANPNPPKFQNPAKATSAQIKAAAGYFARDYAITVDELKRVFALGTPTEPAARVAWNRLHFVLDKESMPAFKHAVADFRLGDGKAVVADFAVSGKFDAEQTRLQKAIGLKVCGAG